MEVFKASSFIWAEKGYRGRQAFISFEQRLEFGEPEPCRLHLFADTRYRLWVNERFVAYGPGRFVTRYPEYDTYDLVHWLTAGENLIRVEVNFFGASSFQSMPDGLPGFIAAGGTADGRLDFATPGHWRARCHTAWRCDAPLFSFAQNPVEICDTRVLEAELRDPSRLIGVRRLESMERPWQVPSPRSVPYPDYRLLRPTEIHLAAPVELHRTFGFQTVLDGR